MYPIHTALRSALNHARANPAEASTILEDAIAKVNTATGLEESKNVPALEGGLNDVEVAISEAHTCITNDDLTGFRLLARQLIGAMAAAKPAKVDVPDRKPAGKPGGRRRNVDD